MHRRNCTRPSNISPVAWRKWHQFTWDLFLRIERAVALVRIKPTSFTLSLTVPTARKLIFCCCLWRTNRTRMWMTCVMRANRMRTIERTRCNALTAFRNGKKMARPTKSDHVLSGVLRAHSLKQRRTRCFRVTGTSLNERGKFRVYNVFREWGKSKTKTDHTMHLVPVLALDHKLFESYALFVLRDTSNSFRRTYVHNKMSIFGSNASIAVQVPRICFCVRCQWWWSAARKN